MQGTDAFLCNFPSSFCELYMPFNRTIIFAPAHRFTLGRCSNESTRLLLEHIKQWAASTNPRHFVAAMGLYDQQYLKYYTGLEVPILESSSLGYASGENFTYSKSRSEILLGPLQLGGEPKGVPHLDPIARSMNLNFTFRSAKSLYGRFELQNLANHRAAVLFPYAVLSYGITELYALGIPLFVPSPKFLTTLGLLIDRCVSQKWYCGSAWVEPPQHPTSHHTYSPESDEPAATEYWARLADFYRWPYIQTFDSWQELMTKLNATNFDDVHRLMLVENRARKLRLLGMLGEWARHIDVDSRVIRQNYDVALKQLWNVTEFSPIRRFCQRLRNLSTTSSSSSSSSN
jgi:hypothetical protein